MLAYQEYAYRRIFGLSKREMMEEPMEDVVTNFKLQQLLSKKDEADRGIMEEKAKRNRPAKP